MAMNVVEHSTKPRVLSKNDYAFCGTFNKAMGLEPKWLWINGPKMANISPGIRDYSEMLKILFRDYF